MAMDEAADVVVGMTAPPPEYSSLSCFTIEKKVGHGQFSVVYRGRCVHDGRAVALKKVQIYEMMDAKARQDCVKEIELLKSLDHS